LNLTELSGVFKIRQAYLKSLDLSRNLLTDIREWEFCGLRNLTTLSLANNLLKNLAAGAFYGLGAVRKLILSHNCLQQLVVEFYYTVEELQLDNNLLEIFNMALLVAEPQIKELELQHNQIVEILQNKDISVRELNLSSNNIVDLGFLRHNQNLESLDLSFNVNATLANQTFEYNTELTNLTMQNVSLNRIGEIMYNLLSYSSNLEQLDFGFNQSMESINFERMPNLPKLRAMKLTGTELTEFNTSQLNVHCGNLSEIDITGNKLNDLTLKALVQYCVGNNITLVGNINTLEVESPIWLNWLILCFITIVDMICTWDLAW
jgi:insulin-like growth factor-binding protein complex acid labile subunit